MCDQHNHVAECYNIDDCVSWCVSLLCYLVFDSNVGPVLLSDYVTESDVSSAVVTSASI